MDLITKELDPTVNARTVVDLPDAEERQSPHAYPIILHVAAASQNITPWGMSPRQRDAELRSFWVGESWLASVVYGVSIRNASFAWEIVGADPSAPVPKNTSRAATRLLKNSNRGKGWKNLIIKTCVDLMTQDNGAFWELIRKRNRPDSPVINISHLDAAQCLRTGDPEYPVIYTDRFGKERLMRWWEIRTIEEFPSPYESAFDMQVCAVSRCLLAAEIIQSIAVYKQEKIGGTFTKAIDVVSGITQHNIDDAIAMAQEQVLNKGAYRFSLPVVIPGVDPTATLSHIHIDLASLPDNFDEDSSFKWYVAQLAAAFGVDYQEIAPLMVGSLGSGQQGEIMHLKTHGKGPALIMGLLEDIINDGLIPSNVEFRFLEQDLRSETEKANARFTRAKERAMRVKSGELDGKAARRLAIADGDLPEWLATEIDGREEKMGGKFPTADRTATEMSSTQVDGGTSSQETQATAAVKMVTMREVKKLRERMKKNPKNMLVSELGELPEDLLDSLEDEDDDDALDRDEAAERSEELD